MVVHGTYSGRVTGTINILHTWYLVLLRSSGVQSKLEIIYSRSTSVGTCGTGAMVARSTPIHKVMLRFRVRAPGTVLLFLSSGFCNSNQQPPPQSVLLGTKNFPRSFPESFMIKGPCLIYIRTNQMSMQEESSSLYLDNHDRVTRF